MSMYLKHFTVVGDDTAQWNNDYKKWEEEETEEEGEGKAREVAVKVESAPRRPTFRDVMKRLFQSHKFQVWMGDSSDDGRPGLPHWGLVVTRAKSDADIPECHLVT